jgi:hypothetical protein
MVAREIDFEEKWVYMPTLRPSAMASYLASYYDVDRQKAGERIVTSDEQIGYLFHVVQEYVR